MVAASTLGGSVAAARRADVAARRTRAHRRSGPRARPALRKRQRQPPPWPKRRLAPRSRARRRRRRGRSRP
eukprot:15485577-Alexandrium_andersonii.AAC.1